MEVNHREGILVGELTNGSEGWETTLNNHLHFTVKVHHVPGGDEVRIVGFEVQPFSIKAGSSLDYETLHLQPKQVMETIRGVKQSPSDISDGIYFSYSWHTVNDQTTTWAHRFD